MFVVLVHLERVNEVEISLREPGRTFRERAAERDLSRGSALSNIDPLPTAKDVGIFDGTAVPNAYFAGCAQWGALVGNLEKTKRCVHSLPRQAVVHIALERTGTIGWQRSVARFALVRIVVEGLVKRTSRVR